MSKVYVTATIVGIPGCEDGLEKELRAVVPLVRQEEGCIRYDLHQSIETPSTFLLYETWASKEALDVHAKQEHLLAMKERVKDMIEGPTQVSLWIETDVKDG